RASRQCPLARMVPQRAIPCGSSRRPSPTPGDCWYLIKVDDIGSKSVVAERRIAVTANAAPSSRGRTWFHALAGRARPTESALGSLLVADAPLATELVRLLAIVPDPQNRFSRVRHGELGVEEGWALARHVREAIAADASGAKRPILAIVDVQSQAYGRLE